VLAGQPSQVLTR